MEDYPFQKALMVLALCGLWATSGGVIRCIEGYIFSRDALHEKSTVGRVVSSQLEHGGRGPRHLNPLADQATIYHYIFWINGVQMDDHDQVCKTPLALGACRKNGPVLVYYTYEPYRNSRLEDFAVAGRNTTRAAILPLGIGLPLLVLSIAGIVILERKNKSDDDPDPSDQRGRSLASDIPDDLEIVPHE